MKLFDIPPGTNEFQSEPVKQFRMAGRFPLHTKILGRFDKARTKEVLPVTIHDDSCGEWVFRADQPLSEFFTVSWLSVGNIQTFGQVRRQNF